MKKILILIATFFLLSILLFYCNNNPRLIISALLRKGDIKKGDLNFQVNLFGIVPVANAILGDWSIEKYEGQQVYHLSATMNPLRIYSKLHEGHARLDSYVDLKSGNPILFRQKIVSPGKESDKEISYDQENGIMTLFGVRRHILPNTQDPLSAVFKIRKIDLHKTKEFEISLNTNQKNYILKGTVQPKEISINNKKYKIFILKGDIKRRDKNPYHQSKITIVLLEAEENIPLLIKVFANGFFIHAKLTEIR